LFPTGQTFGCGRSARCVGECFWIPRKSGREVLGGSERRWAAGCGVVELFGVDTCGELVLYESLGEGVEIVN